MIETEGQELLKDYCRQGLKLLDIVERLAPMIVAAFETRVAFEIELNKEMIKHYMVLGLPEEQQRLYHTDARELQPGPLKNQRANLVRRITTLVNNLRDKIYGNPDQIVKMKQQVDNSTAVQEAAETKSSQKSSGKRKKGISCRF